MSQGDSLAGASVVGVAGRSVTVREATLGELRAHLARQAAQAGEARDLFEVLLIEGWDLAEMALFCDLPADDLATLKPSEIRVVLGAIERLNADFFALRARLRALAEPPPTPVPSSSAPSPT